MGQDSSNPALEHPCLHNQQRAEASCGRSREKACSGCPWYDGYRESSHREERPRAARATAPSGAYMSVAGPVVCGSPNSPQNWVRPSVLNL